MKSTSLDEDPTLKGRITEIGMIVKLARAGARERHGFATLSGHEKRDNVDFRTIAARVIDPPSMSWGRVSELTNVTRDPTAILTSDGVNPLGEIVTVAG